MDEDLARRMAQHPAAQQLISAGVDVLTAQAGLVRNLDASSRQAYGGRTDALRAAAREGDESRTAEFTADLGRLAALTVAGTEALLLRLRTGGEAFVAAFPELRTMDGQVRLDTLTEVIKRDPVMIRAVGDLTRAVPGASPQECEATCKALLAIFSAAGLAMMIIGIAGCVWLGWIPPLMVLCMIGVVAAYVAYLAIAWTIYNGCMANCAEGGGGN